LVRDRGEDFFEPVLDRFGLGRGFLSLWWILGGCAVLTLVFFNVHAVNVTCVAAAGFFIIGAQFVLNNFTAASYETNVRATAVGMELGVGRVGAILGPFVAGALQQNYQSSLPMFVSIGLAALAAGGIILFANRTSTEASPSIWRRPRLARNEELHLPGVPHAGLVWRWHAWPASG
jgi:MFS family permease